MTGSSASDLITHRASGEGGEGAESFNPLTGDLDDLILSCRSCWLWQEVGEPLQALMMLIGQASELLRPLCQPEMPDWACHAATGIARSMPSIHQHAERNGSYARAARLLWTTAIPSKDPTLSDAQLYALLAIAEARTSAEGYADLATGLEDALGQYGIGQDEPDEIGWLRGEREQWRWSDGVRASAERFLLLAQWCVAPASAEAPQQAEQQIVALHQQLGALSVTAKKFHGGRAKKAYSPLTRALMRMVREARSRNLQNVLAQIDDCLGEEIESVIRFDEITLDEVQYTILTKGKLAQIKIDSLRRKLADLPDV